MRLMEQISRPQDIHGWPKDKLEALCAEIREFLIENISRTGGHIGANLGTIELTVALHAVFDSPKDKFLFDTGHQGYTQKILSGRMNAFKTLNQPHGMSRFLAREESEHDVIDATHAGTAISTACGFAMAHQMNGDSHLAVAVVGDGTLVEGLSFEGLNYAQKPGLPLMIVINDNGMAIAPNVGGIKDLFSGDNWAEKSRAFFEGLGYQYLAVPDGHNVEALMQAFTQAKTLVKDRPVVVHTKTIKGNGLAYADGHKYRMHFSMAFNPETGEGASPTVVGETYAVVAAKVLHELMAHDKDIVAISPATPYASSLDQIQADYPDRAIDVGMAEQHAASMAVGLALEGKKPVVCFQSTFMQRAMDQIIHDACYMKQPVTFLAVRSGFAGYDGATHHGIYDLSYLQALPDLQIVYAGTRYDIEAILRERMANPVGAMVILHPYETIREGEQPPLASNQDIKRPECIGNPAKTCLLAVGNCMGSALEVREKLIAQGKDVSLINIRWIKPLPEVDLRPYLAAAELVVTFEENVSTGGFGSRIATMLKDEALNAHLIRAAIPDGFVRFGDKKDLTLETGIDGQSVYERIQAYWGAKVK